MNKTYGPYSPFVAADKLVFTAGQVGAKSGVAPGDITSQTKLALKNLADVLADADSGLQHVVKTTVYLTKMDNFQAMNEVYAEVFQAAKAMPARSTVAVSELPRVANHPLLVEVEAVAIRNSK